MALLQLEDLLATKAPAAETIDITPPAIARVKGMIESRPELAGKGLRLYVTTGGCAGYSYGMDFDTRASEDTEIDCDGLQVFVDRESLPWLKGVRVHYQESMLGSGFEITNPNAAAACGCGTSFSKGDKAPAGSQ